MIFERKNGDRAAVFRIRTENDVWVQTSPPGRKTDALFPIFRFFGIFTHIKHFILSAGKIFWRFVSAVKSKIFFFLFLLRFRKLFFQQLSNFYCQAAWNKRQKERVEVLSIIAMGVRNRIEWNSNFLIRRDIFHFFKAKRPKIERKTIEDKNFAWPHRNKEKKQTIILFWVGLEFFQLIKIKFR